MMFTPKLLVHFVILVLVLAQLDDNVMADGTCGKASPDRLTLRLAPCASAAQDANAPVKSACCSQVHALGQNPDCLCAVLLSNTSRSSGIKPEIAITIPKRCNFADRPVGYQCGDYTLP